MGCLHDRHREVQTFGTMTADLLALNGWLNKWQVAQVASRRRRSPWRPVFHLLETEHEIMLVNAQHMKAVPGRKTDIKDAEWLADRARAMACYAPASFSRGGARGVRADTLPAGAGASRTQEVNRLHKLLETANLTLGAVATDVLGASGREMLEAILAILSGEERSEQLAELARGRLRASRSCIQALRGWRDASKRSAASSSAMCSPTSISSSISSSSNCSS
jgi:transposase